MQSRRLKSLLFKTIAAVITVSLMFGLTACSEDSFEDMLKKESDLLKLRENQEKELLSLSLDSDGKLMPLSYAQGIAVCINDDNLCKKFYDTLPPHAANRIDLSLLQRYVSSLRPLNGEKIENIRKLDLEEKNEYRYATGSAIPAFDGMAENSEYFALEYNSQNPEADAVIVAVQQDEQGRAYLDADWLKAVNKISDFADLYFNSIYARDKQALSFLIQQGERPFNTGDFSKIADLKAESLISFYTGRIYSGSSIRSNILILPGVMNVVSNYSAVAAQSSERVVKIRSKNGKLTVKEPTDERLKSVDGSLYAYGQILFDKENPTYSNYLSNTDFDSVVGKPFSVMATDLTGKYPDKESGAYRNVLFKVFYYGMNLKVEGNYNPTNYAWQGKVRQVEIDSRIYSFGQRIHVGMPTYKLLEIYPFAGEEQLTLKGSFNKQEIQMSFISDGDRLSKIIWSVID